MLREPMDKMQLESGQQTTVPALSTHYVVSDTGDPVRFNYLTAPLWRQKMVIGGAAVFGLLAGLMVSLLSTPVYRARTSLQLEGVSDDPFLRGITPFSPQLPNATAENYLQNQVKLLESETLARRVADKLGIQPERSEAGPSAVVARLLEHAGFLRPWPVTPEEDRIRKVQKALNVRTSLQSHVIELSYDDEDPKRSAAGANVATSEFMELNREARAQLVQATTEWLSNQAKDLKSKLENLNRQLQEFARANNLVFAGQHTTLAVDRMRQIQEALSRAEAERAAKQSRYEAVSADAETAISDALATGPLREYQVNLANMRRELAQLRTQYTPAHYKVQALTAQIAETEKAIDNERKQILGRIKNEYMAGSGLERLLSEAQARQLKTVERQMDKERQYDVMKSEIDTTQKLYDTMLQKVEEAGVASALRTTNVRIIDPAKTPSVPYTPKTPLNMAIGFVIGTIGGIGLVFARQRPLKVNQPGETLQDVPELGVIPSARDTMDIGRRGRLSLWRRGGELGLMSWDDRDTPLWSESFRGTLTSILFSAGPNRGLKNGASRMTGRVLVVTSLDVMEGKTTVLSNLGIAAAERKMRVLLIDADLRRPRLHDLFSLSNDRGLTDILQHNDSPEFVDNSPLETFVQSTHIPDLWVLPRGPDNPDLIKLLYTPELSFLLQRFRKEFDLVLIDTPPMMMYSDARVLGRMSDGAVMVVRANTRSREELKAAYMRLVQDQIPVLGTILNDWKIDPGQGRSYGRYYSAERA